MDPNERGSGHPVGTSGHFAGPSLSTAGERAARFGAPQHTCQEFAVAAISFNLLVSEWGDLSGRTGPRFLADLS